MNEESLLSWEALEYQPKHNSSDWYWTVSIITVALVVICVLLNNILLGIVLALSSTILVFHSKKDPRTIVIDITTKGIRHNDRLYLFEHLHSYHIDGPDTIEPKLVLKSKKIFMPFIIIAMGNTRPMEVEHVLGSRLLEDVHPEPLSHKLLDYLGF